jgi:hypothetical protein
MAWPNHTIQRMEASRLYQFQFSRLWPLASTADGDRWAEKEHLNTCSRNISGYELQLDIMFAR